MSRDAKSNPMGTATVVIVSITIALSVIIGGIWYINKAIDKHQAAKKAEEAKMLHLIQEGKLKRQMFELESYKSSAKVEYDSPSKEDLGVRKWEEGTKKPSYFAFHVRFANEKHAVESYYVTTTLHNDPNVDKPMYSYYTYKGKIYNPIVHVPYQEKKN